jgi:hypothetical protein
VTPPVSSPLPVGVGREGAATKQHLSRLLLCVLLLAAYGPAELATVSTPPTAPPEPASAKPTAKPLPANTHLEANQYASTSKRYASSAGIHANDA